MATTPIHTTFSHETDTLTIQCIWEFDETNVDHEFTEIKWHICDNEATKIVFDVHELTYINSKTIGYFAEIANSLQAKGKILYILRPTHILDTLEVCGITQIIPTWDDLANMSNEVPLSKIPLDNAEDDTDEVAHSEDAEQAKQETIDTSSLKSELEEIQRAIESLQDRGKKLYRMIQEWKR